MTLSFQRVAEHRHVGGPGGVRARGAHQRAPCGPHVAGLAPRGARRARVGVPRLALCGAALRERRTVGGGSGMAGLDRRDQVIFWLSYFPIIQQRSVPPISCRPSEDARGYKCLCPEGYTGVRCEGRMDPCASAPCQGGGTCVPLPNQRHLCKCPPGRRGPLCDQGEKTGAWRTE